LIERVERLDAEIYKLAQGSKSGLGTGGMYTKLVAADIAVHFGHVGGPLPTAGARTSWRAFERAASLVLVPARNPPR
jgi:hypothetical protein